MDLSEILPPLTVGLTFTGLACAKFYGLARGLQGGARVPLAQKLCGT
ncbi:MAG: hypothetical protein HYZ53_25075 [Planctomycetes bacterium]|nr:hypothetical protein [Planctomycetota bacterium]